ncbi:MAG: DUF1566 domain-containing protein [archaeon]
MSKKLFFSTALFLVLLVFVLFGCTQTESDSNSGGNKNLSDNSPSSARFVDNGDGSVSDTVGGFTWMKCDYGLSGNDCSQGNFSVSVPVGVVSNNAVIGSTSFCTGTDSAEAYCTNGALCNDGKFVVVDQAYDIAQYPAEYPIGSKSTQNCYVTAPQTAKERACINNGGVSKNDWRVPTMDEIKSLADPSATKRINETFFPNSAGIYITSTTARLSQDPSTQYLKTYTFAGDYEGDTALSAPLKCVTNEAGGNSDGNGSANGSGTFCSPTLPRKFYAESEWVWDPASDVLKIASDWTVLSKSWTKEDLATKETYVESTTNAGLVSKTWAVEDKIARTETYYITNADGTGCFLTHPDYLGSNNEGANPNVDNNQLTGEVKTINGYLAYKLKTPIVITHAYGGGISTIDYINKDYCNFMVDVDSTGAQINFTLTDRKYASDFNENILTPPSDCNGQTELYSGYYKACDVATVPQIIYPEMSEDIRNLNLPYIQTGPHTYIPTGSTKACYYAVVLGITAEEKETAVDVGDGQWIEDDYTCSATCGA